MLGEFGALGKLVERFEAVMTPALDDPGDDYYAWHAYPMGLFLQGVHWVMRNLMADDEWDAGVQFIDVGCGIGTKMAVASYLGWRVKGIELQQSYAEVARQLLPEAPIMVTNALTWTAYQAELVYTYRLCTDEDDQLRLIEHIVAHMKPGALLFAPNSPVPGRLGKPIALPAIWRIP